MQKLQQLSNLFITPNMIILRKQQASNTPKKNNTAYFATCSIKCVREVQCTVLLCIDNGNT